MAMSIGSILTGYQGGYLCDRLAVVDDLAAIVISHPSLKAGQPLVLSGERRANRDSLQQRVADDFVQYRLDSISANGGRFSDTARVEKQINDQR